MSVDGVLGISSYRKVGLKRAEVIDTLAQIDQRISLINLHLRTTQTLRADCELVRFYLKGGNAFDAGVDGSARPDWPA